MNSNEFISFFFSPPSSIKHWGIWDWGLSGMGQWIIMRKTLCFRDVLNLCSWLEVGQHLTAECGGSAAASLESGISDTSSQWVSELCKEGLCSAGSSSSAPMQPSCTECVCASDHCTASMGCLLAFQTKFHSPLSYLNEAHKDIPKTSLAFKCFPSQLSKNLLG